MFSRDASIVLLLCPSLFTFTFIISATLHLFELGKSKTRIKKIAKSIPLIEKVSLKGYVDRCEYHRNVAIRIRRFYLIYLLVLVGGFMVILLSSFVASLDHIADYFGFLKFLFLDFPFILFCFLQTKHDQKHGGVTWKWETE